MLNIDNELLENLKEDNFLPINNDSFEISNLIKIYNLESDSSIVNTIESQYEIITNFIIELYLQSENLPNDIKTFIQESYNYRIYLFKNIKFRMKRIIIENSAYLFKEIYILLNLLSNGNKYKFLDDENSFSIKDIQLLLNDYEDMVSEQFIKKDKKIFELSFKYYLILLETLNEICIINSLDIQRRKNINELLELITNSINNLKNKIDLEDIELKSLNAVLGKLLLYFTNMTYIPIDMNNKNNVIKNYIFMLNKIHDGYNLLNQDDNYYITFLDKISTLILTLVYKLKIKLHIENISFKDSKELCEIYNLYNNNVKIEQKIEATNLNEFRTKLLNNYKYLYEHSTNKSVDKHPELIDYLISLDDISNIDMIVLHNIVLYSDDIPKDKLDLILKSLLNKKRFNNDYYEFYKLKIIDRIIQRYIALKVNTSDNLYIKSIIKYIEKNNTVSHLMTMYAKIYLSLSLYYSYEKLKESQEISKKFYFIYQSLDNHNFLEKEFYTISRQIVHNYAKNYFKLFNFRINHGYTNDELMYIGKDLIDKYIVMRDIKIKNGLLINIERLMKDILEIKESNDLWLKNKIESLITNKIFFGLTKAKIENKNKKMNFAEIGYDKYEIEIHNDYVLSLYYSSYYKLTFKNKLSKNKEFIELIVRNLIKSYINSIPSYTDIVTTLPNINKLKNELKILNEKDITFFEIYLDSLVKFSESYNVKISNEFFRAIALKVNEKVDAYRLFGPKLGFILEEEKDYKEIVKYLKEIEIEYENEKFKLNPIIAISIGKAKNILEKSFYSLSSAKISNDKMYIFD